MKTKRLLMVILTIALMAAMAIPASAATKSTKTYKGTVIVDAKMDDEWKYAEEFIAEEHKSNSIWAASDPNTSFMNFRTLWDEDFIYVWCEITDHRVVTTKRENHWDTDCMIYHLDYANDKTSGMINYEKAGFLYVTAGEGLVQTDKVWDGAIENFQCAHKMTSTGWIIEMGIPAKSIGFTLEEGMKIGFEPQYNDSNDASENGGRIGLCTWNEKGAGGYANTSLYGTLELSGVFSNNPSDPSEPSEPSEPSTPSKPTVPSEPDNKEGGFPTGAIVAVCAIAVAIAVVAVTSKKRSK